MLMPMISFKMTEYQVLQSIGDANVVHFSSGDVSYVCSVQYVKGIFHLSNLCAFREKQALAVSASLELRA